MTFSERTEVYADHTRAIVTSPSSVTAECRPRRPWEFTQPELREKFRAMLASGEVVGTLYLHEARGYWWSPLTGWPHAPTGFLANRDNVLEIGHANWRPNWITAHELADFFALIGGELGHFGEWAELPDLTRRDV